MSKTITPKTIKVGQHIYIARLCTDSFGNIKTCGVFERIVQRVIRDYCKDGLRYAICKPEHFHIPNVGFAYRPCDVYPTKKAAVEALRTRINERISKLTLALFDIDK